MRARLLRVKPGGAIPQHTHRGTEMVAVLAGACFPQTKGPLKEVDPDGRDAPAPTFPKSGTVTEYWHCDTSFSAAPPAITMLSAEQLPTVGGDTMWCDQYGLYEALSDGMKRMLLGLRAVHYDKQRHKQLEGRTPSDESAAHPVVRTHPVTGRKSLFISGQAEHFEGMTREESRPMLDWLLGLLGQPDYVYRHRWRVGDLLMWDNRCTTHYAIHDYGDHPRYLHRVTLQGDVPR
jgi:taurine dioxygenase